MSLVREYHLRFEEPAPEYPPLAPDPDAVRRRGRLVRAAYEDLGGHLAKLAATKDPEKVPAVLREVLHDAAQLCYVAEGTAVSLGLPFEAAYDEIHRARMAKEQPNMALLVPDHINHEEVTESHGPQT